VRRRRRGLKGLVAAVLIVGGLAALFEFGPLGDAVRDITLPLSHEGIIRQQAKAKHLDPALVAAVIYAESKFSDRTSAAGARGLMQITPSTADFIAHRSGGTAFTHDDLATPRVNISYGTYYLRYLLDRYNENTTLAIAAYNAGETNVDQWVRAAGGRDSFNPDHDIPFAETRAYVRRVKEKRKEYRDNYANELGL
jgi:peptidoglycan lytic transglycosylase